MVHCERFPRTVPGLLLIALVFLILSSAISSLAEPAHGPGQFEPVIAVIHCEYSPVSFWNKTTNTPSGFFVDIMDQVALREGLHVRYMCRDGWDEMKAAVESGEADVSALLKSKQREKTLLFSSPIDTTYLSFFVRSQSNLDPAKAFSGQTVGVIKGSMSYDQLKDRPGLHLQIYGSYREGLFGLLAGEIALFAGEESMVLKQMRETRLEDRIKNFGKPFVERQRGLVVRKDNGKLLELLNRSLDSFIGSPEYQQIYLKWYAPAPYWTIKRIVIAGGIFVFVIVCGMVSWRYFSIFKINQELVRNIAERKQAEKRMRESEDKFRSLFEQAIDGIMIADVETEKHIEANNAICAMLGYARDEIVGLGIDDIHPKKDLPAIRGLFEKQLRGEISLAPEVPMLRKDRSVFYADINATLVTLGGKKCLAGIFRDITERKQVETLLKAREKQLAESQRIAHIGSWEHNLTTGTVFWSDELFRILGLDPLKDPADFKMFFDMIHPDDRSALKNSIDETVNTGKHFDIDYRFNLRDGRSRILHAQAELRRDETGTQIILSGTGQDITDRKQGEEILRRHREELVKLVEERTSELTEANARLLKEIADRERMEEALLKFHKLESLGILAGGIAHDFNNLLATILSNITLAAYNLKEGRPAFRQLTGAERASLQAKELAQQLLTFSRGGVPVKRTQSITDLVKDAAGFATRGSRIRCEFSISDDLWLVDADEGQLSQVIHNLVINADQSMPEGGLIAVGCENVVLSPGDVPLLSPGKYVKITVRDSGVGIHKDHLSKIFDPYFTTKQRGSGLGLATTHSIVKKHGGSISVESEQGVGSIFTIYLPASGNALMAKQVDDSKPKKGTGKILFMDDNVGLQQATSDAFQDLGYSVVCTDDGARTIDLYQGAMRSGAPFDVVLMDLTIRGGMGGEETIKRLLKIDPGVRAIVCSGYSNDPVMADYRRHGFVDVLVKPYNLNQLGEVVYRVMAGHGSNPPAAKT